MELTIEHAEYLFEMIIECHDQMRFDNQGGYPSQRQRLDDIFLQATVDHDDAPELNIWGVSELMSKWSQILSEDNTNKSIEQIFEEQTDTYYKLIESIF